MGFASAGEVMGVTFPDSAGANLAGTTLDVRVPSSAPPGTIIEVSFTMDSAVQKEKSAPAAGAPPAEEKAEDTPKVGGSGGYQTKEYSTSDYTYSSVYETGGYECSSYKSIYD